MFLNKELKQIVPIIQRDKSISKSKDEENFDNLIYFLLNQTITYVNIKLIYFKFLYFSYCVL